MCVVCSFLRVSVLLCAVVFLFVGGRPGQALGSGYGVTVFKRSSDGGWGGGLWRLEFSVGFRRFCLGLWYVHHSDDCFLCILRKCRIAPLCLGVCLLCDISVPA